MSSDFLTTNQWKTGTAPVAVIMLSLNEAHNMEAVLQNLSGWAQEVFLVDSFSTDGTVDIALNLGVNVVQRNFSGFGDQWNFAINKLPISSPWTMKLDPDERLSDELKANILETIQRDDCDGVSVARRLWFMGRPLSVSQVLLRLWRTGSCKFSDVIVNEHPFVPGRCTVVSGELEHYDSPDLEHWLEKQNRYTTAEALMAYQNSPLSANVKFFGSKFERRMWIKKNFSGVVEKGTPLIQLIPFKRDDWEATHNYYEDGEFSLVQEKNFNSTIISHYIKQVWSKKSYK